MNDELEIEDMGDHSRIIIDDDGVPIDRIRQINDAIMEYHRNRERIFLFMLQERLFMESIPDDFWEPVKITTDKEKFIFYEESWECIICRENRNKKTDLKCCKQSLCDICVEEWFTKESIKCPFCKKDIREGD